MGHDPLGCQLLLHPLQVGGVWVPKRGRAPASGGLVVDAVPDDHVVPAQRDATAHREGQLPLPALPEQFEYFLPLGRVGQVAGARGTWYYDAILN